MGYRDIYNFAAHFIDIGRVFMRRFVSLNIPCGDLFTDRAKQLS